MFKYRFVCTNKDVVLDRINQIVLNDLPCGKTLFGGSLYKSGIHIQQSDENIKGFYFAQSENETHRGSPIRVCFFDGIVCNALFVRKYSRLYYFGCGFVPVRDRLLQYDKRNT